jgi:hypothetical protein
VEKLRRDDNFVPAAAAETKERAKESRHVAKSCAPAPAICAACRVQFPTDFLMAPKCSSGNQNEDCESQRWPGCRSQVRRSQANAHPSGNGRTSYGQPKISVS